MNVHFSTYWLENKDGRRVSTKAKEIKAIAAQFNIQVSNPITIMPQEVTKSFLSASKPQSHYEFFMKGTSLQGKYKLILRYTV